MRAQRVSREAASPEPGEERYTSATVTSEFQANYPITASRSIFRYIFPLAYGDLLSTIPQMC